MNMLRFRIITLFVILSLALPLNLSSKVDASPSMQPPTFAELWPEAGVELSATEPITLTFDQPMDRATTEAAIEFTPATMGTVAWSDSQTLVFTPAQPWTDKTKLTIRKSAHAITGLALDNDVSYVLRTGGLLGFGVVGVVPQNGAEGTTLDTKFAISFDRPVVPLMPADGGNAQPTPFMITPAIKGTGRWIDTSTYVFTPAALLAGGAQYTITVPAGFKAIDGSVLAQPHVTSFQTAYPQVEQIKASDKRGNTNRECYEFNVGLECAFVVSFSEAVDPASAKTAFSLTEKAKEQPIQGKLAFSADGKQLIFTPATRLAYDTTYAATLADSALNKAQTAKMARPETVEFKTVSSPKLNEIRDNSDSDVGKGAVMFYFETNMVSSTVKNRIVISPTPENLKIRIGNYNDPVRDRLATQFEVTFTMKPGVQYEVRLFAGAEDPHGTKIQQDSSNKLKVYTAPNVNVNVVYPLLNGSIMMIDASDAHYSVKAQGQTTVYSELYQLTPAIFNQYGLSHVEFGDDCTNSLAGYGNSPFYLNLPKPDKPIRSWQQSFDDGRGTYTRHEIALSENGKSITPGLYLVRMRGPFRTWYREAVDTHDFVLIAATASLTVKSTEHEIFVWVTDLKTALPLPDVPVTLYYNGVPRTLGKTDAKGIARGSLDFTNRGEDEWNGRSTQVYVVAQTASVYGAWYSCYPYSVVQRTRKDFLYTDRPIYRPGETVNVKGILRKRTDMDFSPANVKTVSLTLSDANNALAKTTATVNADGTYSAALTLPEHIALGNAFIAVDDPTAGVLNERGIEIDECPHNEYYTRNESCSYVVVFTVAAFRPPEIQVTVNSDQKEIIQGDPLKFGVAATFYSGGTANNIPLSWQVFSRPSRFHYAGGGNYTFEDERWNSNTYFNGYSYMPLEQDKGQHATGNGGKQQIETTKTAVTNADTGAEDERAPGSFPVELTAEATITDGSAQPVSAHTQPVIAHPASVYVGIDAKRWNSVVGQPAPIRFITVRADSTPATRQTIRVRIARITWTRTGNDISGNYYWRQQVTIVRTTVLKTTSEGIVSDTFTPAQPGTYRIEALTTDTRGRVASSTLRMYVTAQAYGDDIYWQPPQSQMAPATDKTSYKPGETALIEVPTGFVGSSVMLVTAERGSVLWSDVVKLDTPSLTYKLPILDKFAPGVNINFTVYRAGKPDYRHGEVKINVEPMARRLNVQIAPSTSTTTPRGTVSFDVLVTDNQQKPVQAEVSVALVDKSVLALVEPNTPTLEGYFYDSESAKNYVRTTLSQFGYMPLVPDSYIVPCCFGGGAGGPLPPPAISAYIRSNFKYTAL